MSHPTMIECSYHRATCPTHVLKCKKHTWEVEGKVEGYISHISFKRLDVELCGYNELFVVPVSTPLLV